MKKVLLLFLLIATKIFATTINVPSEYSTIQNAIISAVSGDSIIVAEGTYNEDIDFLGKDIVVASQFIYSENQYDIENTIINGSGETSVVTFMNNETNEAKLIGFTIQNGTGTSIEVFIIEPQFIEFGGGIICHDSSPVLRDLIVRENDCNEGGGVYLRNSNAVIRNCEFYNNSGVDGAAIKVGYELFDDSSDVIIENNFIHNNQDSNHSIVSIYYGEADLKNNRISNNSATALVTNYTVLNLEGNSISENNSNYGAGLVSYSSELNFSSTNKNSIYSNNSENGANDLKIYHTETVILDTFTVLYPTSIYAEQINLLDFEIDNYIIEQITSDVFVSPAGSDENSGTSWSEPLKSITAAINRIAGSDSLKTINLGSGTFSPSITGEVFPINLVSNIKLLGAHPENTIIEGEDYNLMFRCYGLENVNLSNLSLTSNYESAIYILDSEVQLDSLKFSACSGDNGAALEIRNSDVMINNSEFIECESDADGGAIYSSDSALNINDCNFSDCSTGTIGGALYLNDSNVDVTNTDFIDNFASNEGGAIYNYSSLLDCSNSVFESNSSLKGGAVFLNGTSSIVNCDFHDNSSIQEGGAINLLDGNTEVINCEIYNNESQNNGTIVHVDNTYKTLIRNSTLFNNEPGSSAVVNSNNSNLQIVNSIIYGNQENEIFVDEGERDTVISHSLIENGEDAINADFDNYVYQESNINADPMFVDPDNFDFNLQENSPAIDAGTTFYEYWGIVYFDLSEDEYNGNNPDLGANESIYTQIEEVNEINNMQLSQNYPNPFNPRSTNRSSGTTINFEIPKSVKNATIEIYNLKGQKVKALKSETKSSVVWDGKDKQNRDVATGVYFYRLKTDQYSSRFKKMMLLK